MNTRKKKAKKLRRDARWRRLLSLDGSLAGQRKFIDREGNAYLHLAILDWMDALHALAYQEQGPWGRS